jgi:integrase
MTADLRIRKRSGSDTTAFAAAAGLSRITFHDLRHSYATGALKSAKWASPTPEHWSDRRHWPRRL